MADPCVDSTEAERSNTLVKDTSASGTPDGVEPYLFPIVACLGCLTTMACGPKDGDFISPAEYARGCKESPYEAALLANTKAGVRTCVARRPGGRGTSSPDPSWEKEKHEEISSSPSGHKTDPREEEDRAAKKIHPKENEGCQTASRTDRNNRPHRNADASPPSFDVQNVVLQDAKRPLTDQELLEQIVTDFSLRAVRFDDSDNRTGLPATLIHLGNGMQLKAEYHLDFRLQNIHFKLCTKENRFIMFFFIPIKHLKDIAIPEELDPVFHASCYDRVGKFVQRPQRAAVLQLSPEAPADLRRTPLYLGDAGKITLERRSLQRLFVGSAIVLILADTQERDTFQCSLKILQLYNSLEHSN